MSLYETSLTQDFPFFSLVQELMKDRHKKLSNLVVQFTSIVNEDELPGEIRVLESVQDTAVTLDIYFAVNRFCLFLYDKFNRRNSRKDRTVDDRRRFDSRLRSHRQRTKREKRQDRSKGNEKNHQKNAKPRLTQYCDIVGRSDGYMKREYSYVARIAFCFDTFVSHNRFKLR